MAKVLGIGGVFFKSEGTEGLRRWYRESMGFDVQPWGGVAFSFNRLDREGVGYTVSGPFDADTTYFDPSRKPFMLKLRVDDLEGMLAQLRERGAEVLDRREDGDNGKFGYVMDPEGTLLKLWEQIDANPEGHR
jgi:predicted enzyme related to lactoylglutathione lyase